MNNSSDFYAENVNGRRNMPGIFLSQKLARFSAWLCSAIVFAFVAGCSSGGSSSSTTTPPATGTAPVATIQISGTPTTIFTDNSNSSTITVNALDASNAAVSGATITLSTSSGQLSSSTLITDATGKATVTFSSGLGFANQANRTATITATSGTVTAMLPVQITGSTLALLPSSSSLSSSGSPTATLTITAKDKGGNFISGTTVTLTQSGAGTVTLTPATGTTNASGQLVVTMAGATAGAVTVSAAAAGTTATTSITVGAASTTFGINLLTLNGGTGVVPTNPKTTAMHIGDTLAVQVGAPSSTSVIFSTTIGSWVGAPPATPNVITVVPGSGIATATLTSTVAGLANVEVLDGSGSPTDTLTVGITAKTAASISLQASPTVVPRSVGSTVGYSSLTATVLDSTGAAVGGAPVAFSIVNGTGTGSGETISPVVVFSASTTANGLALGAAPATFTSGSLSSGAGGIQVRATVVGTSIATQPIGLPNATGSSYDKAITVGGTAGSVAFGLASKIIDAGGTSTIYSFPMSVLVADSNGSPAPLGTVVNISTWPIAWSTGLPCAIDSDDGVSKGTFYNEDVNQNLVLDPLEDGTRKYYYSGTTATGAATKDGQITPLNSYGGTIASTNPADLPGTATTDANGLATFNLTYTKTSALWVIARIRAQAMVQGTPAVGQLDWRLAASQADDNPPSTCYLQGSPFKY
jgi:hypothetical protein